MKHIGVRDFRDHATSYLANGDILAIERHDQIIGFYSPVRSAPEEKIRPALDRLTKAVSRVLAETGMEEEGLSAALRPIRKSAKPARCVRLVVDACVLVAELLSTRARALVTDPELQTFRMINEERFCPVSRVPLCRRVGICLEKSVTDPMNRGEKA